MKNLNRRLKLVPLDPPAPRADVDAAIRKYLMWGVLFITGAVIGYSAAWWF